MTISNSFSLRVLCFNLLPTVLPWFSNEPQEGRQMLLGVLKGRGSEPKQCGVKYDSGDEDTHITSVFIMKSGKKKSISNDFFLPCLTPIVSLTQKMSRIKTGKQRGGRRRKNISIKKKKKTQNKTVLLLNVFPEQKIHSLSPGPEDGVPVNSSVLHTNTSSHYYHFLHHVCWPVS